VSFVEVMRITERAKKKNGSKNRRKLEKLLIEISAIETPRGLVPTVESLKKFVDVLNRVLSQIYDAVSNIFDVISNVVERIEIIEKKLSNLDMKVEFALTKLSELKVLIESESGMKERKTGMVSKKRRENKDLRDELISLLKNTK